MTNLMCDVEGASASSPLLENALKLAEGGCRFFPLVTGTKMPALKEPQRRATSDPAKLAEWIAAGFNLGMLPGYRLVILDLDVKDGKDGVARLEELFARLGLPWPRTRTVRTPTGGLHLYLLLRTGRGLKGKVKYGGLEGVDLVAHSGTPWMAVAPGSFISKHGRSYEVEDGSDIAVAAPELEEWLLAQQGVEREPARRADDFTEDELKEKPKPDQMFAGCAFMRRCRDDQENTGYGDWLPMITNLAPCEDGPALVHEASKRHPGYDPDETDRKLAQKLKPHRCATINAPECTRCLFRGSVTSPYSLTVIRPDLFPLQQHHVLDAGAREMVKVETGDRLSMDTFDTLHAHELGPRAFMTLAMDKRTPKVRRSDYLPGNPGLIVERDGALVLNTWHDDGVVEAEGDCSLILDHIRWHFDEGADHFLNYLAWGVQHPAEKIMHALLVTSSDGTGKSVLVDKLVHLLFGPSNVQKEEGQSLDNQFNVSLVDKQVLVVEEVYHKDKRTTTNGLKDLITGETTPVQQKYKDTRHGMTPRLILMTSNETAPLSISERDRRYWVWHCEKLPHEPAYYHRLFKAVSAQAGAFKRFLRERDLSSFDHTAPPPMTAAKAQVIEDSRLPVEQAIRGFIEEGQLPAVFTLEDLRLQLNMAGVRTQTDHTLSKGAKDAGCQKYPRQVRVGQGRPWLWISRGYEHLLREQPSAVGKLYSEKWKGPPLSLVS